jgi:GntR family transcriptional regulator
MREGQPGWLYSSHIPDTGIVTAMAVTPFRVSATLTDTLADDLRARIYAGELEPSARLPSEQDLTVSAGVSRTTVRRALQQLVHEGLVASRPGVGYHVRSVTPLSWHASRPERNTRTDVSPADSWSQGVREQGREPSEDIDVAIIVPPQRIASRLRLAPGESAVARKRVRRADGELMSIADSYYPERIVRGTPVALPGDCLPGAYAVFEKLGLSWARSRDEITIRMPTREEAARLGLSDGTPVAESIRTTVTADGTPVRVQVSVLPGDRNVITYDIEEDR